jgi:hypothetical protein
MIEGVRLRSHRARLVAVGAVTAAVACAAGAAFLLERNDGADANAPTVTPPAQHFASRPDLLPPTVTVRRSGRASPGYIFLAPKKEVAQAGPMIVDSDGKLVWFHPLDTHGVADFRLQRYGGRPVLTWWRGRADRGVGDGYYVIMSSAYREIAHVGAGNGLTGDIHEFLITPQGTALLTVYHRLSRDLTAVGGPAEGAIYEGVVQEVDIATGEVLFEWHSAAHVALAESYAEPPARSQGADAAPYDYFHVNSIELEPDGNLLVSARNTHAVYEISRKDGRVLWRLGGKRSDFAMGAGTAFAWQHDARRQPDGSITLFDNGADPKVEPRTRILVLRVDTTRQRVTLVRSYHHPLDLLATSQGNAEFLPDGHLFVGWGAQPYFTEFDAAGTVVLDGHFGAGADSYRAFRFPWVGSPAERPALVATRAADGTVRVTTSWNGATEVARWQVLAGPDEGHLSPVAFAARAGFETTLALGARPAVVQTRALDRHGAVLGSSRVVAPESS